MRWRTPITLLVLLGVLLGAAYYGWRTIDSDTGKDKTSTSGGPKCVKKHEFHKGQRIASRDILVNVYNAGSIESLAGNTLASLHAKGFRRGLAANAPDGVGATNVTILTRHKELPQVQLVARQFEGRVVFRPGLPLAPGIDVVVGDGFVGMKHAAKRFLRLHHVVHTCTSTGSASG